MAAALHAMQSPGATADGSSEKGVPLFGAASSRWKDRTRLEGVEGLTTRAIRS
jgi:hypothetical protein